MASQVRLVDKAAALKEHLHVQLASVAVSSEPLVERVPAGSCQEKRREGDKEK